MSLNTSSGQKMASVDSFTTQYPMATPPKQAMARKLNPKQALTQRVSRTFVQPASPAQQFAPFPGIGAARSGKV